MYICKQIIVNKMLTIIDVNADVGAHTLAHLLVPTMRARMMMWTFGVARLVLLVWVRIVCGDAES